MRLSLLGLVIAVITSIGPSLALADGPQSAKAVAQQVASSLKTSGKLSNYHINVKYEEGTATLVGRVISAEQRLAAEQVASQVPGVHQVNNQLQVTPVSAAARGPAVRAALVAPVPNAAPQLIQPIPTAQPEQAAPVQQVSAPELLPQLPVHQVAQQPVAPQQMVAPPAQMQRAPVQMAQAPAQQVSYPANMAMSRGHHHAAPMQGGYAGCSSCGHGGGGMSYDEPHLPNYAWPSYASHPNYAAVTYPRQHSAAAWPYIGPFYPYPQVPLGWRKVTLEWKDGWWFLDFND